MSSLILKGSVSGRKGSERFPGGRNCGEDSKRKEKEQRGGQPREMNEHVQGGEESEGFGLSSDARRSPLSKCLSCSHNLKGSASQAVRLMLIQSSQGDTRAYQELIRTEF